MKKQVVIIHGGDSFRTKEEYFRVLKKSKIDFRRYTSEKRDWKDNLRKIVGSKFDVITPEMPNKRDAKYLAWKLWFEKFIPYLSSGVVLIGHSLGGIFLVKYLSENKFPKSIRATFLIAPPHGEGTFTLPKNFRKLIKQGGSIFLYHSKDDRIVPFKNFIKYQTQLTGVTTRIFKNRGHFNQAGFPELIKDISNLS